MNVSEAQGTWRHIGNGVIVGTCAMAACILVGWLVPTTPGYGVAVSAALLFTALVTGVAIVRYFATRDLMDPLVLFSAALAWYFGLHTLWLATATNSVDVQHEIFGTFVPYIAPGLLLLALGYLALVATFALYRPRSRSPRSPRLYSHSSLIIVFAFGMTMNFVLAASGAFTKQYQNFGVGAQATGNIQTYHTFAFVAVVALVLCTTQHYRTGGFHRLMWFMLIVEVAFGFAVAEKALAFQALFAWLAARNYTATRLSVKTVASATLVALFVVAPVIQASRTQEQYVRTGDQGTLASARATAYTVPERVTRYMSDLPGSALAGWDILNRRTFGSESLALAIADTPSQYPYLYGRHLPVVLAAPIPHFLWPGKPSYDPSTYFSETYAGETAAQGFGLTIAPTLPGDLYMNFGWGGVIVGMTLIGVILRLVIMARTGLGGGWGIAVFVAAMLQLVLVESDITSAATVVLQLAAVALAYGVIMLTEALMPARRARRKQPTVIASMSPMGTQRPGGKRIGAAHTTSS